MRSQEKENIKENLRKMENNVRKSNVCLISRKITERMGGETTFKETIAANFLKLLKITNSWIQKGQ